MVKLRVKAIRVGNSLRVAIPSEIIQVSGVKEKETLLVDYDEKTRTITLEKESK
jgi:antitoxin component of MazEF toxin-antitoxin module